VRRVWLPVLFALGFLAAGALSATVVAATGTGTTTTGTDTTATTTTGSTTTGTTTTPPPPPPPPTVIPTGVTIAGVQVGGLSSADAKTAVLGAVRVPLVVKVGKRSFRAGPIGLGAVPQLQAAVKRALAAAPDTDVPLTIAVRLTPVRKFVANLAKRFDHAAVDSVLKLRGLKPWISKPVDGKTIDRARSVKALVAALKANRKGPVKVLQKVTHPAVGRTSFGPIIVIHRGSNRLYLYRNMKLWRIFGVASGQSAYPTPLGHSQIEVKAENPWWYPPDSPWAAGAKPIPPGPGNPLGTRWMGLGFDGVGIHGTPDAASIGYSASHGCIRMYSHDAEWLFVHVDVGTQVFIVSA
jgi:lipoprotein-anchoring transpeptidase ErfK/SrfK